MDNDIAQLEALRKSYKEQCELLEYRTNLLATILGKLDEILQLAKIKKTAMFEVAEILIQNRKLIERFREENRREAENRHNCLPPPKF